MGTQEEMPVEDKITLSDVAIKTAVELRDESFELKGKSLRVYIEGKGCGGFYYGVTFDLPNDEDHIYSQRTNCNQEINVIVDKETIEFVQGSTISWVDDERGRGFLVENPNHKKFKGKFFNRPKWKEKLTEKILEKSSNLS